MKKAWYVVVEKGSRVGRTIWREMMKKEPGIDGILVTVGLCIIALLLCVVMKDSLTAFIRESLLARRSSHRNMAAFLRL